MTTNALNRSERTTLMLGALVSVALLMFVVTLPAHAATLSGHTSMGMTGADVSNLQSWLAQDSSVYPEGKVTGYYGSLTEAAVKRYQAKNGISQTGTVGPLTLAAINSQSMGGTGGSDDEFAPIISLQTSVMANATSTMTSTPPQNGATFMWMTNEPSFGRVLYSASWPFVYANAPSISEGTSLKTAHMVTIPNLVPNATYYYVVESQDISGNTTWTLPQTMMVRN